GDLALAFDGVEEEVLVFTNGAAERTAELLPAERRLIYTGLVLEEILRIEPLVALEDEARAVKLVLAGLGDDVDRRAFAPTVGGGEALRADDEFLHGFERELHHRTADGVVFVINAVDGDVDVAPLSAVDAEDRIAHFGRVIGGNRLHARSEKSQIGEVAAIQRQVADISRTQVEAEVGPLRINNRGLPGDDHCFSRQ